MKVFVLVPIYNEELNIPSLYERLTNSFLQNLNVHYILSDDGSTDNSYSIICECFHDQSFECLRSPVNKGPGHAFNQGFEHIINKASAEDLVLTIEGDNTSDLADAGKMIDISELGYDLVLASIYAEGGGYGKTTLMRKILSTTGNLIFRFVFDLKTLTLSSFFRVYRVSALLEIKERYGTLIEERGFISMLEILLKFTKSGHRVIEVPTTLRSGQRKGNSKMRLLSTTLSYFKFLLQHKFLSPRSQVND